MVYPIEDIFNQISQRALFYWKISHSIGQITFPIGHFQYSIGRFWKSIGQKPDSYGQNRESIGQAPLLLETLLPYWKFHCSIRKYLTPYKPVAQKRCSYPLKSIKDAQFYEIDPHNSKIHTHTPWIHTHKIQMDPQIRMFHTHSGYLHPHIKHLLHRHLVTKKDPAPPGLDLTHPNRSPSHPLDL